MPIEPGAVDSEGDALKVVELERLGLVRRGDELPTRTQHELERPGPRVRGGRAVAALLEERLASAAEAEGFEVIIPKR